MTEPGVVLSSEVRVASSDPGIPSGPAASVARPKSSTLD